MIKTSILTYQQKKLVDEGLHCITQELQHQYYRTKEVPTTEYIARMKEIEEIRELLHIT